MTDLSVWTIISVLLFFLWLWVRKKHRSAREKALPLLEEAEKMLKDELKKGSLKASKEELDRISQILGRLSSARKNKNWHRK